MNRRIIYIRLIQFIFVSALGIGIFLGFINIDRTDDRVTVEDAVEGAAPVVKEPEELGKSGIINKTMDFVSAQKVIDQELMKEFSEGTYTFEDPFVVLNPYDVSPLTAVILFRTNDPVQISVHIAGGSSLSDIDFKFEDYLTDHYLPIYGLFAGRVNDVEITAMDKSGRKSVNVVRIETENLPDSLRFHTKARVLKEDEYEEGMNFLYLGTNGSYGNRIAIDAEGTCRWYLDVKKESSPFSNTIYSIFRCDDGTLFVGCGQMESGFAGDCCIIRTNLLGKILDVYYSPYGNHHEIVLGPDHTLLAAGANKDTPEYSMDAIYAIDLETGEISSFLDYKDVLMGTRARDPRYSAETDDWCHINAIECNGDDLIVSSNYQSAIICNDWNGTIKWMLCEKEGFPSIYWDKILTPVGDDFKYCYSQHHVRMLPDADEDPDTIDILLFDNGRVRSAWPLYSRLVIYRINEKEMTVEQLWSYGDDRPELYADLRSSAQYLSNGNIFGMFDVSTYMGNSRMSYHPALVEVNQDREVVWECHVESGSASLPSYRGYRYPLYGSEANTYSLSEEPDNFIPDKLLQKYGYITETSPDPKKPEDSGSIAYDNNSKSEETTDGTWQVTVNEYKAVPELKTIELVPQYIGDPLEVPHENVPSENMIYLIINLSVNKQKSGGEPFDWDKFCVDINGEQYFRMENDSFLTDHEYDRMSGNNLKIGSNMGWVCVEIPADVDLGSADPRILFESDGLIQSKPIK